jgi:NAD(P)-dependent dehydrogenase (short-subunit alcohol dehydrogenase family)
MTDRKVWFITGAARGSGVQIAEAALPAVQWSSQPARVRVFTVAIDQEDGLPAVKLDITDPAASEGAVQAAA